MDTFPPMMLRPFTGNNGHSVCDVHHKSNKLVLCLPFRDGLRLAETVSAPSSCFPFSAPAANHSIQTSLSHCLLLSFAKLHHHNVTATLGGFPHARLQHCTLFEDSVSRHLLCCKVPNKLGYMWVKLSTWMLLWQNFAINGRLVETFIWETGLCSELN